MAELSVIKEKNALKTAEMSGKGAKMRHFPYIKQNSIAEIVSTMESFLVAEMGFDWMMKKAKCEYNDGLFAARDCAFE